MAQWLLKRWLIPLCIAAGVSLVAWIPFLPSFSEGRALAEEFLEHRLSASPFTWTSLFAEPLEATDPDTTAVYLTLSGMKSFVFRGYERRETGRMTFTYEIVSATEETQTIELELVNTHRGWRIARLTRGSG